MGDLLEFFEEWDASQAPPSSKSKPAPRQDDLLEFFEEWQASQAPPKPAPRPSPKPPSTPAPKPAQRPPSDPSPKPSPPPQAVLKAPPRPVLRSAPPEFPAVLKAPPRAVLESAPSQSSPPVPSNLLGTLLAWTSGYNPFEAPRPEPVGPETTNPALQRVLDENGWTLEDFHREKQRRFLASRRARRAETFEEPAPIISTEPRRPDITVPLEPPEYEGVTPNTLSDAAGRMAGPVIQTFNTDPDPVQNLKNIWAVQGGTAQGRAPFPSIQEAMFPKEHKTPGIRQALGLEPPPANLEGGVLPPPTSIPERIFREATGFVYENTNPADPLNWIDWATGGAAAIEDGLLRRAMRQGMRSAATSAARHGAARLPRTLGDAFSQGIREAASEAADLGLDVPVRRHTMDIPTGPEREVASADVDWLTGRNPVQAEPEVTSAAIEQLMDRVDPEWRANEVRRHLVQVAADSLDRRGPDILDRYPLPPQVASGQGPDTQAAAAVRAQRRALREPQDGVLEGPDGEVGNGSPPAQEVASVTPPEPAAPVASPDVVGQVDPASDQSSGRPPGAVVMVDPDEVRVDAKTYQFKAGGDVQGVTDRLRDVKIWDPVKSGKVIIHQRNDGNLYIVDGHQRLAFAKRAKAAGQDVHLDAMVFREADGHSPADMRVMAASKNLAEDSGTAIDAARVIREAGEDHSYLQDIPRSSTAFQDGRALARLGDEAFEHVVNETVQSNFAAHVGRLIEDPVEQVAALRALERVRPQNSNQALSVVQDVKAAGFGRRNRNLAGPDAEQGDLFGDAGVVVEDLLGERAVILDSAARSIKNDKRLFRAIVDGEGRLSDAGNVLAKDTNRGRLTADEQLLRALDEARYVGPVADALNAAARKLKSGASRPGAVEDFLRTVREQVLGDVQVRDGSSGSALDPGTQAGRVADHVSSLPARGSDSQATVPDGGFTEGQQVLVRVGKREVPGEVRRPKNNKGHVVVKRADTGQVKNYPADRVRSAEAPPVATGTEAAQESVDGGRHAVQGLSDSGEPQPGIYRDLTNENDGTALQFYSPNTKDLTRQQADEAFAGPRHGRARRVLDAIDRALGTVNRAVENIRGVWQGDVDNSTLSVLRGYRDIDDVLYRGAIAGRVAQQKAVFTFEVGRGFSRSMLGDGTPGVMWDLRVRRSGETLTIQDVEQGLADAGIGDYSVSETADGFRVLIGDEVADAQSGAMKREADIKAFADACGAEGGYYHGRSFLHEGPSGGLPEEARRSSGKAFDEFVRAYHSQHPERRRVGTFQGPDRRGPEAGTTVVPASGGRPGRSGSPGSGPPAEGSAPTPDTLEASRPGALPSRSAPEPANTQPPALQAAPGPAHRPTPATGNAVPAPTPLPAGRIPDVKSKQALARAIADALKVRFQFGRALGMRKRNPGRYHPKRNLVELAHSGDLDSLYHEAGHALDINHGLRGDLSPEAMAEVERLADPGQTPGTMSSWQHGMPKDRKQMEGVAELLRRWFEDDTHARQVAPHATTELNVLLDRTGDLGRKLRKAQTDYKLWNEAPSTARILGQISFSRPGTPLTVANVITSLYDQYHPIAIMSEHLRQAKGVDDLPPSQDPYILARLTKGLPKVVEAVLGTRSKTTGAIQGGMVDFATRELKPGSKSLKAILEPLEDDADKTTRFVTYLVARRAKEYLDNGKHPGFHPDDINQALKDLDSPEFQRMAQEIYDWNDGLVQYAVDGGFLDARSAEAFRDLWKSYVPFHRLMEVGTNEFRELGGGTGKGIQAADPQSFKRVRGMADAMASTEIVNPLEAMIQNAMAIVTATERNRIGQVLAKHWDDNVEGIGAFYREVKPPSSVTGASADELVSARKLRAELKALGADLDGVDDADLTGMLANFEGLITRQKGIPDAGTNTIRVKMPDGKVRMFELTPEIYKAWTALSQEEVPAFVNFLGKFANVLRLGATTLSPVFVLRNVNRDSFTSAVISRTGHVPYVNIIQGLAAMTDEKLVREWLLSGGGQAMEANLYTGRGFERAQLEIASGLSAEARKNTWLPWRMVQQLRERPAVWARGVRRNSKGRFGRTVGAIAEGFAESPIDMLGRLAEGSEMTVRLAEYQKSKARLRQKYPNWSEADINARAAFESRDLMDFSMSGSGPVRHVRRIVPFFGARMTGNYRLLRALKEDPKGTVARGLFCVSAPTMALYAWNQMKNGDNYNQLPQRERDTFWHIAKGTGPEDFIRIPKPFLEGALFGSTIERFAQFAWQKDPEAFRGHLAALGAETLPINVMDPLGIPADLSGPGISTLIEIATNYDFWRQRSVVPDYLRNDRNNPRPNWMESNEYTTATSKAMAKLARKVGLDWSPMMIDHAINGLTATAGSEFTRGVVDPVVHALTGEDRPKARPRKWMGFVYTENISESEDRYRRLFKDVGERAAEAKALGQPFEDEALWAQLRAANKQVLGIRKQLRATEDEAERRRLLDDLRAITSEFTPAAGPNVLQRR